MSKTKKEPAKKHNNNPKNIQEKLDDNVNWVSLQSQNQNHNVKKESLGPNTKR